MKPGTRLTIIILGMALLGGALVVAALLRHGISARDAPTTLETLVARSMRHLAVPNAYRKMKNPIPLTQEVLVEARSHFADHCAHCHGNDGRGATSMGRNMYPKTPDMTSQSTQSLSDGEIFYIIKNGIRLTGMPAWGDATLESDRESWHLVHFIRHLPQLTQEDLREMEGMNPRSPREAAEEELENRFLAGEDVPQTRPQHHH